MFRNSAWVPDLVVDSGTDIEVKCLICENDYIFDSNAVGFWYGFLKECLKQLNGHISN